MKKTNSRNFDLGLLLIYPVIATIISLLINSSNVLFSILMFFGIPSIYLSYKGKEYVKKSLIFSLVIGIPFTIIIEYIANYTKAWDTTTSFSYKFLGHIGLEMFIWGVAFAYFIIIFYEYFLDKSVEKRGYNKNLKYFIILLLVLLSIFFILLITNTSYLKIPYSYLVMGLVLGVIPLAAVLLKFPRLLSKFLKTGAYFFFLTFTFEITALKLGWWKFPIEGQFLGWVTFLGHAFPIEELIVWMLISAMGVLAYYEYFDDDQK